MVEQEPELLCTATEGYVQCAGCGVRFIGGDFQSRVDRWLEHSKIADCHLNVDSSLLSPEARDALA